MRYELPRYDNLLGKSFRHRDSRHFAYSNISRQDYTGCFKFIHFYTFRLAINLETTRNYIFHLLLFFLSLLLFLSFFYFFILLLITLSKRFLRKHARNRLFKKP